METQVSNTCGALTYHQVKKSPGTCFKQPSQHTVTLIINGFYSSRLNLSVCGEEEEKKGTKFLI